MKVFLLRGKIINEQCLAGAGIINQKDADESMDFSDTSNLARSRSSIFNCPPSSNAGVSPLVSVPSVEAGRIIYQREDLALMENVYYMCITVIFPVQ